MQGSMIIFESEREQSDQREDRKKIKRESLPWEERFLCDKEIMRKHYLEAYDLFPSATRDSEELKKAMHDYIREHKEQEEDIKLFRLTPKEKRNFRENKIYADDAAERTVKEKEDEAIEEIIETLRARKRLPPKLPKAEGGRVVA